MSEETTKTDLEIIKYDKTSPEKLPEQEPEMMFTIPAAQLDAILTEIEDLKKQRDLLKYGVLQICGVLGLTNEARTEMKPEVVSGQDGVFKNLLKAGADLFGLFAKTNFPGAIGKKAEEKIKQEFAFVEKVLPALKDI